MQAAYAAGQAAVEAHDGRIPPVEGLPPRVRSSSRLSDLTSRTSNSSVLSGSPSQPHNALAFPVRSSLESESPPDTHRAASGSTAASSQRSDGFGGTAAHDSAPGRHRYVACDTESHTGVEMQ